MRSKVLKTKQKMKSCMYFPSTLPPPPPINHIWNAPKLTTRYRLKLGVYRSLGIDAEQDHNTGDFTRAVIRNTAKGNVNVVNLDSKFDRFFYANHFWNSM